MDMQRLLKAQVVVAVLAGLAIGLFLLIYALMGDSTPAVMRLFTALLVPPLILVLVGGGYFLFFRKDKTPI
jgi:uncharacterized RDD family membrane protein YckC